MSNGHARKVSWLERIIILFVAAGAIISGVSAAVSDSADHSYAACVASQQAKLYRVLHQDSQGRNAQIRDIFWLLAQTEHINSPAQFRRDLEAALATYNTIQRAKPAFPLPPTEVC